MSHCRRASHLGVLLFSLAGAAAVLGCSSGLMSTPVTAATALTGNWQLRASASTGAGTSVPSLSGELTGTSASVSGLLHPGRDITCTPSSTVVAVSGSTDKSGLLTMAGSFAGGTLTVTGVPSADGTSLSAATVTVTGGACASPRAALASAQLFSPITGTYSGTFVDPDGNSFHTDASLSQTPASDTSGNFQLSGSATLPNNPCFSSPVSISNTQVTGGTFQLTYADASTGNSVDVAGTFSQDGNTLSVTQWTLSGPCGPDHGTGTLTRH